MKKFAGNAVTVIVVAAMILAGIRSGGALSAEQMRVLKVLLIVCGCSIAYCFIVGELTHNYSQMDKLWSLLPIAYIWIIAANGGFKRRLVMTAVIVTVWGMRLTINFARKGAYRLKFWEGEEDYRWSIVHSNPIFAHKAAWILFNLLFISIYQNLLVLAICLPALAAMESNAALGVWDLLAAAAAISFLTLETVADKYQWHFHEKKKELLAQYGSLEKLPAPYNLGFNTTGPWGYMRHPNYLGEQGIWVSLYLISVGAGVTSHVIFHWTIIGPMLLILLFMGSSALGEAISASKYPRYADYMEQVWKYAPVQRFDADKDEDEAVPGLM